jgi:hypothetical protein
VLDGEPGSLVAQPSEVDRILHVPLAELLDPEAFHEERWTFPSGVDRPLFFYEIEGDTIWGATGRMLTQLLCIALDLPAR